MENQQNQFNQHYPFTNVPLPYGYAGLEPYIDTKTMQLHHDKHLQTYIDNLNAALERHPELQKWSLEELVIKADSKKFPEDLQTALRHNAGGVYNHFYFFDELRPSTGQIVFGLSARLRAMLSRDFGSFEDFKDKFATSALGVFGSGYAWLVIDKDCKLSIVQTKNQLTPLTMNLTPLLNLDVWEHAYYLKHYNVRADYIKDFWSVVDWAKLSKKLDDHCAKNDGCVG